MRGLSCAEAFAPYHGGHERSPRGKMRSDWRRIGSDLRIALSGALAQVSEDVSHRQPAQNRGGSASAVTSVIAAHWSGPLPSPAELEKLEQIVPGGAERLLCMAEKELGMAEKKLDVAEKELDVAERKLDVDERKLEKEFGMAEKEQAHRFEDTRRGQYLGWSLAVGAIITAAAVSLCHGPWQASVALVGIPMLGAVHSLIQGRSEEGAKKMLRRFRFLSRKGC